MFDKNSLKFSAFLLLASVLVLSSCASMQTQQRQYVESVPLARDGNYAKAADIIKRAKSNEYKEKDRVLYYLDLGMLYHWAGLYEESNEMLDQAEIAIEELFTKSVSKALASGVLNDNALDYAGEDYEDIYLNVFKGLNYLALGNRSAALVELRRVEIKLNILEDKYKTLVEEYNNSPDSQGELVYKESRFHNDVLSRYLSMILYRAEGSYDDARIDRQALEEAWMTQPQLYDFPKPELPVVQPEDDSMALVNLLSFSGMSPVKQADTFYLQTLPNLVILGVTGQDEDYVSELVGFTSLVVPGIKGGIHFKIQFPRLSRRSSDADRVVLKLNGEIAGELPLLEKMDSIAQETFRLKQPLTVGKTIIRAVIKNVGKEVGKEATNEALADQGAGGLIAGILLGIAADIAVDATENADLRISQFFPATARALEVSVVPGTYEVVTEYWNGNTLMATINHGERVFSANDLNLVESYLLR